jgi:hypothetical protein
LKDSGGRGSARLKGLLKFVFAAVILAVVLKVVPWGDRLLLIEPSGEQAFAGSIEGDWKGTQMLFVPEAGPLPESIEALRGPDGKLAVTREIVREALEPGQHAFDWRPGMPRVFREMELAGLLTAMGLFLCGHVFATTRWWRLLNGVGCPASWYDCLRLTGIGFFFNLVMPGLTGGDLVKAVLVTREHPERKEAAFVSVVVDRVIGLLAMAGLAVGAILLSGDTFAEIRAEVMLFLAGGLLGAFLFVNRALRRALRIDALLAKLPLGQTLKRVDEAVLLYSQRPLSLVVAVLLSLCNQAVSILAVLTIGRAFGDTVLGLADYVGVFSVATIVSAIPAAPGGWGLGEATYGYLFDLLGASAAIGVATSITFRLCQLLFSLLGGLFLLGPGGRVRLEQARHAVEE